MNTLRQLEQNGQAPWLDFVSRRLIESGELRSLIEQDGLRGMTSNPTLFEKDITETNAYDQDLRELIGAGDMPVGDMYERLAITEIRRAAAALRPVFVQTGGADGFVSLEVSPYLALDTEGTIKEARRLWRAVDRANIMVKVPATIAGLPAIRRLLAEGINVNITLLFGLEAYRKVAEAYLEALEERLERGEPIDHIASVASFFISRIDTAIDRRLREVIDNGGDRAALEALIGKVAIANAKLAYARFKALFSGPRWERLAAQGAHPQRLLWASTSTKDPTLPDTLYVEALIGAQTVDTMPPATLAAFREHGHITADAIENDLAGAGVIISELGRHGIVLKDETDKLVVEGVRSFAGAFDRLLGAVAKRRAQLRGETPVSLRAPPAIEVTVRAELDVWREAGYIRRLWARDPTLWTGHDEDYWLGWLDVIGRELDSVAELKRFADWVRARNFSDVCLIGMGGSSLGPEVLEDTLGGRSGWPRLHIMDSTDPQQIRTLEDGLNLRTTLFIVASKSGTTLEPDILHRYFFSRLARLTENPGAQFVAITDPGSKLEEQARADNFAWIFHGVPEIGGRYSVLSKFGLVPAAAIGVDSAALLRSSQAMLIACGPDVPPAQNPGVQLGVMLGVLARDFRRDKVTVFAASGIATLGAWLEQLLAESTGKQGRGLIPVPDEAPGEVEVYGEDRVFVHLALAGRADGALEARLDQLALAGQPVLRVEAAAPGDLGQEFFRWEIAVAVAGAVLNIDPFDQPDVEASKAKTRALMAAAGEGRVPAAPAPLFDDQQGIAVFADAANAAALGRPASLDACLSTHLARLDPGDYLGLLAFIERNPAHSEALERLRAELRDRLRVATCLGFGPRFLHSSGQLYKGGPDTGVFIQITCADRDDIDVPGLGYRFGMVKAAQAQGDLEVLGERGRRVLRVHLADIDRDLPRLAASLRQAAQAVGAV